MSKFYKQGFLAKGRLGNIRWFRPELAPPGPNESTAKNSSPTVLFLSGVIAVQTVRDVLGSLLIACSSNRLASIGDDFALVAMYREIFGL
jgi:hypothetical protein